MSIINDGDNLSLYMENSRRIIRPATPRKSLDLPGPYMFQSTFNKIEDEQYKKMKRFKAFQIVAFIFLILVLVGLIITILVLYFTNQLGGSKTTLATRTTRIITTVSNNRDRETNTTLTTTPQTTCGYGYVGPYCDECGKQFYNPNVKIIGGVEANEFSWPSTALVLFKYRFYYTVSGVVYEGLHQSICGGTLINRKNVLTAAQCFRTSISYTHSGTTYTATVTTNSFHKTFESMYKVYLGLHTNNFIFGDDSNEGYSIINFLRHPNFDSVNLLNDIAILKLNNEVILNNLVQPACLTEPSLFNYPQSTGGYVWSVGWGRTTVTGSNSNSLNNVMLTLYDPTDCNSVSSLLNKDWNRQLCAGDKTGTKDTCLGDTGGPLFVRDIINGNQKYILAGITSYGEGCGLVSKPRIFTKISFYINWILQNQ